MPIGPCSFISPFNFPLNLAAHKIAPALAVGCPFVMKPASRTPLGAIIMGEVLAETDLPKGAFSILPAHREGADLFTTDERLKLLSFTGSPAVGWDLKAKAGKKKVVLELGGNAAVIVDRDADLDDALERIIFGAFYQSGQSCIGVQRILIHADVYDEFRDMLVAKTKTLVAGDPKDRNVFIGPMIARRRRSGSTTGSRRRSPKGATLLCGGKREGAMLEATLLENVDRDTKLNVEEAFGPVAFLIRFGDFDEALDDRQRQQVRPPGRHLHPRPLPDVRRLGPARGRRRRDQRRAELPRRQHALWRGQGFAASAAKASASRWRT